MAKKKGGNVNRLLNPRWANHAHGEWQLWDRSGNLWRLATEELNRSATERYYFDPLVSRGGFGWSRTHVLGRTE